VERKRPDQRDRDERDEKIPARPEERFHIGVLTGFQLVALRESSGIQLGDSGFQFRGRTTLCILHFRLYAHKIDRCPAQSEHFCALNQVMISE
jgi:hypothetical protein